MLLLLFCGEDADAIPALPPGLNDLPDAPLGEELALLLEIRFDNFGNIIPSAVLESIG